MFFLREPLTLQFRFGAFSALRHGFMGGAYSIVCVTASFATVLTSTLGNPQ